MSVFVHVQADQIVRLGQTVCVTFRFDFLFTFSFQIISEKIINQNHTTMVNIVNFKINCLFEYLRRLLLQLGGGKIQIYILAML